MVAPSAITPPRPLCHTSPAPAPHTVYSSGSNTFGDEVYELEIGTAELDQRRNAYMEVVDAWIKAMLHEGSLGAGEDSVVDIDPARAGRLPGRRSSQQGQAGQNGLRRRPPLRVPRLSRQVDRTSTEAPGEQTPARCAPSCVTPYSYREALQPRAEHSQQEHHDLWQ